MQSHFYFIGGRSPEASAGSLTGHVMTQRQLQSLRHRSSVLHRGESPGEEGLGATLGSDSSLTTPLLSTLSALPDVEEGPPTPPPVGGGGGGAAAAKALLAQALTGAEGAPASKGAGGVQNDIIYGVINAVVGLPTMISFAAIVYSDPLYKPLLGQLARFSFLSAAVHQAVFTIFSSLPFAVGQPQDVGLIFLSAMATSVADIGREEGLDDKVVVGTALLTMTVATLLVGFMTTAVAKFKLATLVQYMPLPVVGGYLGYVGYFCLAAGIGLGSSVTIDTFASWTHLLTQDALIKFVPTFGAAVAILMTMKHARSPWALPAVLVAVPLSFHAFLLATGHTLTEAQDAGWVLKPAGGKSTQQFWELYSLFNIHTPTLDGVYLPAVWRQLPKMLGLFFVVTFGSCLDVAAIQADMPEPIDFNGELATVGLSNIIVGATGSGYTGSYIFSQTIFSMRAGVASYLHGAIIAVVEGAIFLLPISVVQYLPTFFFGALLTVFGIEIAGDWLVRSYAKVTRAEYVLLLATFLAIMQLELEMGVAAGILMSTLYFAYVYARVNMTAFTVVPTRSAAVRTYRERHLLDSFTHRSVAVGLSGYIFFGSSVLIASKVTEIAESLVERSTAAAAASDTRRDDDAGAHAVDEGDAADAEANGAGANRSKELRLASLVAGLAPDMFADARPTGADLAALARLSHRAPHFVLLDFRRVLGVDATAAQTFGTLAMSLRRVGVELVLCRVSDPTIRRLFIAHGLISPGPGESSATSHDGSTVVGACKDFKGLNDGAKYAEDTFLAMAAAAGLISTQQGTLSLEQFLAAHLQPSGLVGPPLLSRVSLPHAASGLAKHGFRRFANRDEVLYDFMEEPREFFLVLKGTVNVTVKHLMAVGGGDVHVPPGMQGPSAGASSFQSGPGAVVGSTDVVLRRLRSFRAVAATPCVLLAVSHEAMEAMATDAPEAVSALQAILLRDACLNEIYALEVLERSVIS